MTIIINCYISNNFFDIFLNPIFRQPIVLSLFAFETLTNNPKLLCICADMYEYCKI